MNPRHFLTGLSGVLATAAVVAAGRDTFAVPSLNKSKSDWKVLLPSERYAVLFEEDTERPFSSPLNHEKRKGTFVCAACFLPLFDTAHNVLVHARLLCGVAHAPGARTAAVQ